MSLESRIGFINYAPKPRFGQIGFFNRARDSIRGIQIGVYNCAFHLYGAAVGLFCNNTIEAKGLKIAPINHSRIMHGGEIGLLNEDGDVYGLRIGLINHAYSTMHGVDIGIINEANHVKGLQGGLFNDTKEILNGVQIGAYCEANKGTYLQLGLITMRKSGPWYTRVTPFIGFCSSSFQHKEPSFQDKTLK